MAIVSEAPLEGDSYEIVVEVVLEGGGAGCGCCPVCFVALAVLFAVVVLAL